jgi:tetratricopeptide (TPR) repeat protein
VALTAEVTNRPREALAMLARIDTTRGWGRVWKLSIMREAAFARHKLGEYGPELELARQHAAAAPGSWPSYALLARALPAVGRAGEFPVAEVERLADDPSEEVYGVAPSVLLWFAREARAHGQPEAATDATARAIAWYRGRPESERMTPAWRDGLGEALLVAQDWSGAREHYGRLARADPDRVTYRGALGVVAAHTGDRAGAEAALARLARVHGPFLFGEPSYWRARILAVLGRGDEAVTAFEQALREGHAHDYRYRDLMQRVRNRGDGHAEPDFDALRALPRFLALTRPKG